MTHHLISTQVKYEVDLDLANRDGKKLPEGSRVEYRKEAYDPLTAVDGVIVKALPGVLEPALPSTPSTRRRLLDCVEGVRHRRDLSLLRRSTRRRNVKRAAASS